MTNVTLADTILKGLNNPECAYFVGNWMGEFTSIKLILLLYGVIIAYRVIDKLAFTPFLDFLKKKIYKDFIKKRFKK